MVTTEKMGLLTDAEIESVSRFDIQEELETASMDAKSLWEAAIPAAGGALAAV